MTGHMRSGWLGLAGRRVALPRGLKIHKIITRSLDHLAGLDFSKKLTRIWRAATARGHGLGPPSPRGCPHKLALAIIHQKSTNHQSQICTSGIRNIRVGAVLVGRDEFDWAGGMCRCISAGMGRVVGWEWRPWICRIVCAIAKD